MLFFSESSFAAASAPVRDARKTGFVELLAIIAIVILFLPGAFDAAAAARAALSGPFVFSPPHAATAKANAASEPCIHGTRFVIRISTCESSSRDAGRAGRSAQATRGKTGTPLIDDNGNDDRAADDDPFIVLIEVQCANRLSDQHNEQCAKGGAERASAPADETSPPTTADAITYSSYPCASPDEVDP